MSYIPGIGSNGFSTPADYKVAQTNSKTQTGGTEDLNLYQSFQGWQIATDNSIFTVATQQLQEKYNNGQYKSDEDPQIEIDFNDFYNEALEFAEDFSFAKEGKTYNEQIKTLAQEHIQSYDTINTDGKVDYKEFTEKELANFNAKYAESLGGELSFEDEGVEELFKASFEFFDINGDNAISESETAAYYNTLDILDGTMYGKIKFSTYNAVSNCLMPDVEEGTIERDNKLKIEETMTKIYNTNFAQGDTEKSSGDAPDPQNDKKTEPQKPIEPGVQTNIGKSAAAIEKNLITENPIETNTAQGCEIL